MEGLHEKDWDLLAAARVGDVTGNGRAGRTVDVAAAVAAPGRTADNVKLDE